MISSGKIAAAIRQIVNRIDKNLMVYQNGCKMLVYNDDFKASVEIKDSELKIVIFVKDRHGNWRPKQLTE